MRTTIPETDAVAPPGPSPFRLDGERALITGGATGIGFAIARSFVAAGAHVALVGRRQAELDLAVAALGPTAHAFAADLTKFDEASGLRDRVEAALGPPSILVNNAGKHLKGASCDVTESDFQSVLDIHVVAAYALTRHVARGMLARGRGHVLFVASMAAVIGLPSVAAYAAAKSADVGLTRSLAVEWSPHGVRVNAIAPGWVDTPMLRQAMQSDPARLGKVLARTPLNRLGHPDDVGWAAVYLSSPAARFVTGAVLTVDGGASIGF